MTKSKKHTNFKINEPFLKLVIEMIVGPSVMHMATIDPDKAKLLAHTLLVGCKNFKKSFGDVTEDNYEDFMSEILEIITQTHAGLIGKILFETAKHGIKAKSQIITSVPGSKIIN